METRGDFQSDFQMFQNSEGLGQTSPGQSDAKTLKKRQRQSGMPRTVKRKKNNQDYLKDLRKQVESLSVANEELKLQVRTATGTETVLRAKIGALEEQKRMIEAGRLTVLRENNRLKGLAQELASRLKQSSKKNTSLEDQIRQIQFFDNEAMQQAFTREGSREECIGGKEADPQVAFHEHYLSGQTLFSSFSPLPSPLSLLPGQQEEPRYSGREFNGGVGP